MLRGNNLRFNGRFAIAEKFPTETQSWAFKCSLLLSHHVTQACRVVLRKRGKELKRLGLWRNWSGSPPARVPPPPKVLREKGAGCQLLSTQLGHPWPGRGGWLPSPLGGPGREGRYHTSKEVVTSVWNRLTCSNQSLGLNPKGTSGQGCHSNDNKKQRCL